MRRMIPLVGAALFLGGCLTMVEKNGALLVSGWPKPAENVAGYNLYMSERQDGGWTKISDVPIKGRTVEIYNLELGKAYWFHTTQITDELPPRESDPSQPWSRKAVTKEEVARSREEQEQVEAGKATEGVIEISGLQKPQGQLNGYYFYMSDNPSTNFTRINQDLVTTDSYTLRHLEAGKVYHIKYSQVVEGRESVPTQAFPRRADTVLVNAPAGVQGPSANAPSAAEEAGIVISGLKAPQGRMSGYHFYMSAQAQSGFRRITREPVTTSTYVVRPLQAGRTYYFMYTMIVDNRETGPSRAWALQAKTLNAAR